MEWTGAVVKLGLCILCIYVFYKMGCLALTVLECIRLLKIVSAGSTSTTSHLNLYVCPVAQLDSESFKELYDFLAKHGEISLDSEAVRKTVTATYSHVVMVRRRTDGILQGYLYYAKERGVLSGRKYTLFKIGPMVFSHNYRRNVLPLLVLVCHTFYELVFHPTRSVFFVGKSTTYKSYLSGISKTQYYYPRYDRETPEFETDLLHKFAESVCSPGETYDRKRFVLEREVVKFNQSTAFITDEDMKNPHIRFFVEQNPGWAKGHSLFGIGQITWWQAILLICRSMRVAQGKDVNGVARGSKRDFESKLRRLHDRHLSYQTDIGKKKVIDQYWMATDTLQHRRLSDRTRLDSVCEIDEYDTVNVNL